MEEFWKDFKPITMPSSTILTYQFDAKSEIKEESQPLPAAFLKNNKPSLIKVQFNLHYALFRHMVLSPTAYSQLQHYPINSWIPISYSSKSVPERTKIVEVPVDTTYMELCLQWKSAEALTSMQVPRSKESDGVLALIVSEANRLLKSTSTGCESTITIQVLVLALAIHRHEYDEGILKAVQKQPRKCYEVFCPVCQDEFVFGVEAARLPCSHLYHRDCINSWLQRSNTCPTCRYKLA